MRSLDAAVQNSPKRRAYQNPSRGGSASVTVEAVLLLPVFIYLMINLMTLFDIARVMNHLTAALHQTGREIGIHAFDLRFAAEQAQALAGDGEGAETEGSAVPGNLLSVAYASGRVRAYMEENCPQVSCIRDGLDGISYLRSGFLSDGDIIDLVASCQVQPLIRIFGFEAFSAETRYFGHAWTGYAAPGTGEGEREEAEETVYVARTGTVYHRSAACSYLNPSVRGISFETLRALRNDSGARYYPCEACGGGTGGNVFVTTYGTRYHNSASCSALLRTTRSMPLSEAGALYRPCSKCGSAH